MSWGYGAEIAARIESLGGTIGSSAANDSTIAFVAAPAVNMEAAGRLLSQIVREIRTFLKHFALVFLALATLLPFLWMLGASLKPNPEIERVALLPESPGITVPHMGWNSLNVLKASPLLKGFDAATRFYFVHSFAGPVNGFTLASCDHGMAFAAVVQRGNFSGVQFHPERSGAAGAQLLKNFLEMPV